MWAATRTLSSLWPMWLKSRRKRSTYMLSFLLVLPDWLCPIYVPKPVMIEGEKYSTRPNAYHNQSQFHYELHCWCPKKQSCDMKWINISVQIRTISEGLHIHPPWFSQIASNNQFYIEKSSLIDGPVDTLYPRNCGWKYCSRDAVKAPRISSLLGIGPMG